MNYKIALILILIVFCFSSSKAEKYIYEPANIEIEAPANWTVEDDNGDFFIVSPKYDISFMLNVYAVKSKDSALVLYTAELEMDYTNVDVSKRKDKKFTGMPGAIYEGFADDESTEMAINFVLIELPNKQTLIVSCVCSLDMSNKFRGDISSVLNSIKLQR